MSIQSEIIEHEMGMMGVPKENMNDLNDMMNQYDVTENHMFNYSELDSDNNDVSINVSESTDYASSPTPSRSKANEVASKMQTTDERSTSENNQLNTKSSAKKETSVNHMNLSEVLKLLDVEEHKNGSWNRGDVMKFIDQFNIKKKDKSVKPIVKKSEVPIKGREDVTEMKSDGELNTYLLVFKDLIGNRLNIKYMSAVSSEEEGYKKKVIAEFRESNIKAGKNGYNQSKLGKCVSVEIEK